MSSNEAQKCIHFSWTLTFYRVPAYLLLDNHTPLWASLARISQEVYFSLLLNESERKPRTILEHCAWITWTPGKIQVVLNKRPASSIKHKRVYMYYRLKNNGILGNEKLVKILAAICLPLLLAIDKYAKSPSEWIFPAYWFDVVTPIMSQQNQWTLTTRLTIATVCLDYINMVHFFPLSDASGPGHQVRQLWQMLSM